MSDYYTVLGLQRLASVDEIRAAYRRLVADPQAADRKSEIEKAYGLLSDPGARGIYDQTLRLKDTEVSHPVGGGAYGGGAYGGDGMRRPAARRAAPVLDAESESGSGRFWLILIALVFVAGSLALYGNFSRQQEKIRLEREREIQLRAQLAEEERKRQEEADLARTEENRWRRDVEETERRNRQESERALRDADQRSDSDRREAERDAARAARDADRAAREARAKEFRQELDQALQERERRARELHNLRIIERPVR